MNAIVEQQSGTLLAVIERAAKDPATDVEKMERLMAMYERVQAKNAEQQFTEAMILVQGQVARILPNKMNKQTSSKYATYTLLDKVLRPLYIAEGFSLSFDTGESPADTVKVLCYVSHKAGHTRTYRVEIPADGKGAKGGDVMTKTHAMGSGMSYGKRYLLTLIFNLAIGEDDDGNAATATEQSAMDAIYDKIDLSQSLDELKKVHPEVESAAGAGKRNLIAAYNKRVRQLKGLE